MTEQYNPAEYEDIFEEIDREEVIERMLKVIMPKQVELRFPDED